MYSVLVDKKIITDADFKNILITNNIIDGKGKNQ